MKPMVLALVTARGGSKGIPRKNVVPLAGKPLIAWTIEAALRSRVVDRIVVSTDDPEIAELSWAWGAEVPFLRPEALARDDSPHVDVVVHAVMWLEEQQGYIPDYVLLLQPTSPLRTSDDIDAAVALALEKRADAVISVCLSPVHPYLMRRVNADGKLKEYESRPPGYLRRQTLPPVYIENGAIYLVKREVFLRDRSWYSGDTYAYIMPEERSIDVDTIRDLKLAAWMLAERSGEHSEGDDDGYSRGAHPR